MSHIKYNQLCKDLTSPAIHELNVSTLGKEQKASRERDFRWISTILNTLSTRHKTFDVSEKEREREREETKRKKRERLRGEERERERERENEKRKDWFKLLVAQLGPMSQC